MSETNFKMRNAQKIFHHLFRATVAKFAKNMSWVKGVVKLDHIEHVHHFHSVNSQGMPQKYTTEVGGHFHAVTWEIGSDGIPKAKCGPSLTRITKNTPTGTKTNIVPTKWLDTTSQHRDGEEMDGEDVVSRWIEDRHTHDLNYVGTDELSHASITSRAEGTAAIVDKVTPKIPTDEIEVAEADPRTREKKAK